MNININQNIAKFLQDWINLKMDGPEGKTFSGYYNNYYNSFGDRLQHFYIEQTKELLDHIASAQEMPNVLEVGCGTGTESLWMAVKGANVLGVDIHDKYLESASRRQKLLESQLGKNLNCKFINLNVLNLKKIDFDIVWMEQAFHHLEPRNQILSKISDLVKPGGVVIISEVNALNPLMQLLLFKRRGFKTVRTFTDVNGEVHMWGDERVLSAKKLTNLLQQYGFNVTYVKHYRIFPSAALYEGLFGFEKKWPQWMKFAFTHYNIVAKKI